MMKPIGLTCEICFWHKELCKYLSGRKSPQNIIIEIHAGLIIINFFLTVCTIIIGLLSFSCVKENVIERPGFALGCMFLFIIPLCGAVIFSYLTIKANCIAFTTMLSLLLLFLFLFLLQI